MAIVIDTRKAKVFLALEPVVRNYLNVFPEDLLGLPPHKEIDFMIELELGTIPISKVWYKITST